MEILNTLVQHLSKCTPLPSNIGSLCVLGQFGFHALLIVKLFMIYKLDWKLN